MNQKIIVVDDFYDIAHKYYKSFFEKVELPKEETTQKISHLLGSSISIVETFKDIAVENTNNQVTANLNCDWIAVIYLTMPSDCVFKKGMSFYTHKVTKLDTFPDDYSMQLNGWQTMEDLTNCFDVCNLDDWSEYMNIFVKYNRMVLFRANHWHSYGSGFGTELNNSMMYQKILINV